MISRLLNIITAMSIAVGFCLHTALANEDEMIRQLKSLSLDALSDMEITIAGKTPQKASDVPAAIYVVTQDAIRRMGATNIPEALRMVPGIQVSQLDANKWAITIRGFNNIFSNKLLVMIDGRTVYTPLFAGVYWDAQDLMIEDIERIEVVRGPGATVWGANAVNGVINIISKSAADTQGSLLAGTLGTEQGIASGRYGGKLSEDSHYRIYAKYQNHDNGEFSDGSKATDGWNDIRGGFRIDWDADAENKITVQGDAHTSKLGERVNFFSRTPPTFVSLTDSTSKVFDVNLLTRWAQTNDDGTSQELKVYYDFASRDQWTTTSKRGTADIEYQYHFALWKGHDLLMGAGYRFVHDELSNKDLTESFTIYNPRTRQTHLFSAFIQDDISLIDDTLWLTIGSKFEHNDYTGFEVQPNARLRWKLHDGHLLWASVSRAVRTPSRVEHDGEIVLDSPVAPGVYGGFVGTRDFDSEELIAYELGYRFKFDETLNLDLALFYNDYNNVRSVSSAFNLTFPP